MAATDRTVVVGLIVAFYVRFTVPSTGCSVSPKRSINEGAVHMLPRGGDDREAYEARARRRDAATL